MELGCLPRIKGASHCAEAFSEPSSPCEAFYMGSRLSLYRSESMHGRKVHLSRMLHARDPLIYLSLMQCRTSFNFKSS